MKMCETWNALDKINDDKIIVGGGDDRIATIITISKDFINNVKIMLIIILIQIIDILLIKGLFLLSM